MKILQSLPNVQVILEDGDKAICSVKVAVERVERIDSGSMLFHHPRYIVLGQLVVFSKNEISGDQAGALFFRVTNDEEIMDIINNINDFIPNEKDKPDDCLIIEQNI